MPELEKAVRKEFSDVFIVNLRGVDIYYHLDDKGGDYIFNNQEPIAITFLVKNPKKTQRGIIRYVKTRDNAKKGDKLQQLLAWEKEIPWEEVKPDTHHDWFHQRNENFKELISVYEKEGKKFDQKANGIFTVISAGLETGNNPWLYNFFKEELLKNAATMIGFYNEERERWEWSGRPKDVKDFVEKDETRINWTRELLGKLSQKRKIDNANPELIRTALYKPFIKTNLYYDPILKKVPYQIPKLFPEGKENKCILISDGNSSLSALMTSLLPDRHILKPSDQLLPLYWYIKNSPTY